MLVRVAALVEVVCGEQARQAGLVDRPRHDAAAVVVVVVGLVGPGDVAGDLVVVLHVAQQVGPLGGAEAVGEVVALGDRRGPRTTRQRRGACRQVGIEEGPRIGREAGRSGGLLVAVVDGVLVGFDLALPVEEGGELAVLAVVHELHVRLVVALVTVEVPGLCVVVKVGRVGAVAVPQVAGIEAQEGPRGLVAAQGLAQVDLAGLGRIAREGVDRAAQIASGRHAQGPGARRQVHPRDVLAADGAGRREAIVVAVLLIAERHAVERITQLLRREAVDEQRQVLLVVAPGVGGHIDHARQGLDRLQWADPGKSLLDFLRPELDRRARLPRHGDHDLRDGGVEARGGGVSFGGVGAGGGEPERRASQKAGAEGGGLGHGSPSLQRNMRLWWRVAVGPLQDSGDTVFKRFCDVAWAPQAEAGCPFLKELTAGRAWRLDHVLLE